MTTGRSLSRDPTNRGMQEIRSRQVVSPGGTVRVLSPRGTARVMSHDQPDQSTLIRQQAFNTLQTPARQSDCRIRFNRPSCDLISGRIRHVSRTPSRSPTPPRRSITDQGPRGFRQTRGNTRKDRSYDREDLPASRRRISFTPARENGRTSQSNPRSLSFSSSQRRHEEELLWQQREVNRQRISPRANFIQNNIEPCVNPAQALTMDTKASPFSAVIQSYYVGRHVKIPDFDKYDDTSDPFDHILTFKARMVLCGDEDALYCKLFPTTLSGEALRWFHNLPPNSIDDFSQLASKFALHYRFN